MNTEQETQVRRGYFAILGRGLFLRMLIYFFKQGAAAAFYGGLLITAAASSLAVSAAERPAEAIARVDGYAITVPELELFMSRNKAQVANKWFRERPVVTPAMWTEKHDGETASEELRRVALKAAIQTKVRQILYRETHLETAIDFSDLVAACANENQRRAAAAARGEVVYGPRKWTLDEYIRNQDDELFIRFREQLRTQGLQETSPSKKQRSTQELTTEAESIIHDRLARAHVTVDRAALARVPIP